MIILADVETNGLIETENQLLELALVVLDDQLTIQTQVSYLWPQLTPIPDIYARTHSKVQKMHTDNGLWSELFQAQQTIDNETAIAGRQQIEDTLLLGLSHYGIAPNAKTVLMGRNPGFDLKFFRAYLPRFAEVFGYHQIDICSFEIRAKARFGDRARWGTPQPHRALADCLNELEELKWYEGLTG